MREAGTTSLTIDLDATIIASGKRECLYTYRAAHRKVPGERGYQPQAAFCPELRMVPWIENRDGNVPAAMDNQRGFEEALLQLPGEVRQVTLHTDGAGYQAKLLRACNNPAFRPERTRRLGTIGLVCGATCSEDLMAEFARLADDAWRPVAKPAEPRCAQDGSDKPPLECAELPSVSNASYSARREHVIRYVVTRRTMPGALGLDQGELPASDGRPAYRIGAYMTNFPAPDALEAEKANGLRIMETAELVAAAHELGGHGKEVHVVLKSDLAAGMMPSGRFGANAAWLWLSALALNAMALVRRAAYGQEWHWVRMKRIRAVWIHLVARVVRHGCQVTVALGVAGAHLLAARRADEPRQHPADPGALRNPRAAVRGTGAARPPTCDHDLNIANAPSRQNRGGAQADDSAVTTETECSDGFPEAQIDPTKNQLADQGGSRVPDEDNGASMSSIGLMSVRTVGLDLGKHWFQVHAVDENGVTILLGTSADLTPGSRRGAFRGSAALPGGDGDVRWCSPLGSAPDVDGS